MTNPANGSGDAARKPIAVFLLDDHEIVRRGVRDLLEAEPDIRVVGEAGTASSALARIPALRPDVAVPATIYLVAPTQHLKAVSRDVQIPATLTEILGDRQ